MDKYLKPIPALDEVSKPFWQGCRREELLLQRCNNCGRFQFYPRPLCVNCMSQSLEWVRSSGKGAVYSFTVTHQTTTPGFAQELPYVFAIVELAEGQHERFEVVARNTAERVAEIDTSVVRFWNR